MLRIAGLAVFLTVALPALLAFAATFSIEPVESAVFVIPVEDVTTTVEGSTSSALQSASTSSGGLVSQPVSGGSAALSDAPPLVPVIVDPVLAYLGETCSDFAPAGADWVEFHLSASGALANGVYEFTPSFAVMVSNATASAFDWAANIGIESVMVQTSARYGNLYRYAPAALAGGGLASPSSSYSISEVTFCVARDALPASVVEPEPGPASSNDLEPVIDAPDKLPADDPDAGTFFAFSG